MCVKMLKATRRGSEHNFWREVSAAAQLRHPHLLQFLGACTDPPRLCIVAEYMGGGSLFDLLHTYRVPLPFRLALRLGSAQLCGAARWASQLLRAQPRRWLWG